jgi:hypothetical protein
MTLPRPIKGLPNLFLKRAENSSASPLSVKNKRSHSSHHAWRSLGVELFSTNPTTFSDQILAEAQVSGDLISNEPQSAE